MPKVTLDAKKILAINPSTNQVYPGALVTILEIAGDLSVADFSDIPIPYVPANGGVVLAGKGPATLYQFLGFKFLNCRWIARFNFQSQLGEVLYAREWDAPPVLASVTVVPVEGSLLPPVPVGVTSQAGTYTAQFEAQPQI